ncbi:8356_t:CDS:2 [Ambispora leptoticha]|uniref:8356_t:CDS:1 n=1 Tax=Ambispora leptoticha TaxID=144679 RepID=A0A9N8V8U6_9GLOM|nr:8356_t:CDS:2 [Ambispora leptoticha]
MSGTTTEQEQTQKPKPNYSSALPTKSILTHSSRSRFRGGKSTAQNHELCDSCHGAGHLICCDGCPRAFHFLCVNPPLDYNHPPEGNWYCVVCSVERNPPPKAPPGLFSELFDHVRRINPVQFELPTWIKDSFEGVTTEPTGHYPDYTQLQDEKGNYIYCHWCRKPPSRQKPAIPCDYCPMYWHLDCLDPPLVKRPSLYKKWMCPCHVDHLLPKVRRLKNSKDDLTEILGTDNTALTFETGEYDENGKYIIPEILREQMKARAAARNSDWDPLGYPVSDNEDDGFENGVSVENVTELNDDEDIGGDLSDGVSELTDISDIQSIISDLSDTKPEDRKPEESNSENVGTRVVSVRSSQEKKRNCKDRGDDCDDNHNDEEGAGKKRRKMSDKGTDNLWLLVNAALP